MNLDQIFRNPNTKHRLTLFKTQSIKWVEGKIFLKNNKPYIKCLASEKDRPAKPEEIVRQLWIKKIIEEYSYPKDRLRVEYAVWFGSGVSDKSADIVIMHEDNEHPYIIFEVKKPKRNDGIKQLKSYCNAEGSPLGAWSNGEELIILNRQEPNTFVQISSLPTIDQNLQDIITEQWTIDKLISENKLVKQQLSLKKIILDLEDLVLANAEGIDDTFDEVFKLIYAKLYDEWSAKNDPTRDKKVHFRIYGESPIELSNKINNLFNKSKDKWRGIFSRDEKIKLKPEHLLTCVSFLQDIRLFNANLQIIDEAFEYLITEVAKGKKGQYFTPRWVIDMCVKILNPKINERVIDPSCGSSGFTTHSIFWVAGQKFTIDGFDPEIVEYANSMIYAIDSSPKAVKIAKALNLIAGDGKSNVFELNSLNPVKWNDTGKSSFRDLLTRFDENSKDEDNQINFQNFDFDIVMTNPPFSGGISEREILRQYVLAEKSGRTVSKIGRDIIFIERNIKFLKDGGRMAIVLPQGRLSNSNDLFIRNYIFNSGRVLGVIGLHGNTFKPHTGAKTSVLIFQKYTDEERKKINEIKNKFIKDWEDYFDELKLLISKKKIEEKDLSNSLISFLEDEFDDMNNDENDGVSNEEDLKEEEDEETLKERIEDLEKQLNNLPGRSKGKASIKKALKSAIRKLASRSLKGQFDFFMREEKLIKKFSEIFLNEKTTQKLNYNIFFAVSEKGGKDNSGDLIYKKNNNNDLVLDEHGHLIVENDLDDIANDFIKFAKKEKLNFYKE